MRSRGWPGQETISGRWMPEAYRVVFAPGLLHDAQGLLELRQGLARPTQRLQAVGQVVVADGGEGVVFAQGLLPDAEGFLVDYVEERWGRRFAAAFLEGVRLIDNVPILERR